MNQNRGETTQTNFKMYKKGRMWLFSAALICTGTLGITTVAHADTTSEVPSALVADASTTTESASQSGFITSDVSSSQVVASSSIPTVSTAPISASTTTVTSGSVADTTITSAASPSSTVPTNPVTTATAATTADTTSPASAPVATTEAPVAAATTRTAPKSAEPTGAPVPNTTSTIYTDEKLTAQGVNVDQIDKNNALGIASLFHIFSNSTELSTDVNGNIATGDLVKGDTDFGTRHYDGDLFYLQNLSGTVLPNSFRATSSLIYLGQSVSATEDRGNVFLKDVHLTNVTSDQIYKDMAGSMYINFTEEFKKLRDKADAYYKQATSDGITISLSDMNNRVINATEAVTKAKTNGDKYIYANIPLSILLAPQPISIKGLASDGPTLIINVTDTDDYLQGRASAEAFIQTQVKPEVDGEILGAKERTDFSKSVLLWNFGTDHLDYDFTVSSGYFIGSVLAPNASIIAHVNMDGNIIADAVHIERGESHRFDLQTPGVTDPTNPTDPTDPTNPTDPVDPEKPVVPEESVDPEDELTPGVTPETPTKGNQESVSASVTKPAIVKAQPMTATMTGSASTTTTQTATKLPQTDEEKQSTTIWGLVALAFTGLFGLAAKSRSRKK